MAHEIEKLLLEHSESFHDREAAVATALKLGLPLNEVEAYFDWLNMLHGPHAHRKPQTASRSSNEKPAA